MYLSLFTLMAIPLFLTPLWSSSVYQELWEIERIQIRLDNAAIRVARADRALLEGIRLANQHLKAMELGHHPVHVCARTPVVGLKCRAADLKMEWAIRRYHASALMIAKRAWQLNGIRLRAELVASDVMIRSITRSRELPVESKRCSLCGLPIEIKIGAVETLQTRLQPNHRGVEEVWVAWEQETRSWNYAFKTARNTSL